MARNVSYIMMIPKPGEESPEVSVFTTSPAILEIIHLHYFYQHSTVRFIFPSLSELHFPLP
jgi:hypothetical protein